MQIDVLYYCHQEERLRNQALFQSSTSATAKNTNVNVTKKPTQCVEKAKKVNYVVDYGNFFNANDNLPAYTLNDFIILLIIGTNQSRLMTYNLKYTNLPRLKKWSRLIFNTHAAKPFV